MKQIFTDQLKRKVEVSYPTQRIISLVPSQTELLHHLGLETEVVGITKFCIHPESWFRNKERIGGTKQLHLEKIKALNPDLIIGNKEENDQEQISELMKAFPVWMSDVRNLEGALQMIKAIGEITAKNVPAVNLISLIRKNFEKLQAAQNISVAYFIWQKPLMTAGKDTFIHDIIKRCGFRNVFAEFQGRYPQVTEKELADAAPGCILLSSEPFPFREKHMGFFRKICPGSKILLVDGEMFSWYGSRLLFSPGYFNKLMLQIKKG